MPNRATALVERLYVNREACIIRLAGVGPPPKDQYFKLLLDHPNYNALYSLALSAAINRYPLTVRATGEFPSDSMAQVEYLVVDW